MQVVRARRGSRVRGSKASAITEPLHRRLRSTLDYRGHLVWAPDARLSAIEGRVQRSHRLPVVRDQRASAALSPVRDDAGLLAYNAPPHRRKPDHFKQHAPSLIGTFDDNSISYEIKSLDL